MDTETKVLEIFVYVVYLKKPLLTVNYIVKNA